MTVVRRYVFLTLNLALHALHQALIVFSVVGWMFCETRLLNLIVLSLILLSWYGLGHLVKSSGIGGYCLITDLQWKVREKLGLESRSGGYTKYLADHLLKREFDEKRVDKWATAVIFTCAFASLTTNWLYGSCQAITNQAEEQSAIAMPTGPAHRGFAAMAVSSKASPVFRLAPPSISLMPVLIPLARASAPVESSLEMPVSGKLRGPASRADCLRSKALLEGSAHIT